MIINTMLANISAISVIGGAIPFITSISSKPHAKSMARRKAVNSTMQIMAYSAYFAVLFFAISRRINFNIYLPPSVIFRKKSSSDSFRLLRDSMETSLSTNCRLSSSTGVVWSYIRMVFPSIALKLVMCKWSVIV